MQYKPIIATIDSSSNSYTWLTMTLTEGKNREIRITFKPFVWWLIELIEFLLVHFNLRNLIKVKLKKISK